MRWPCFAGMAVAVYRLHRWWRNLLSNVRFQPIMLKKSGPRETQTPPAFGGEERSPFFRQKPSTAGDIGHKKKEFPRSARPSLPQVLLRTFSTQSTHYGHVLNRRSFPIADCLEHRPEKWSAVFGPML